MALRATNVFRLRGLRAANQEQHDRRPILAEVDPVTGAEHHTRFLDAASDALTVAEVAGFESQYPRLDPRANRLVERRQPFAKRDLNIGRLVLTNAQSQGTTKTKIS